MTQGLQVQTIEAIVRRLGTKVAYFPALHLLAGRGIVRAHHSHVQTASGRLFLA